MKQLFDTLHEDEGAEAIEMLLLLPILIAFIFLIVDVSLYFNARASVSDTAQDAARQVAIHGGNNSPLNNSNQTIAQQTYAVLLNDEGGCSFGLCSETPTVSCTPNIVHTLGQEVSCSITYHHRPITSGIFGMSNFLKEYEVTQYARSETFF